MTLIGISLVNLFSGMLQDSKCYAEKSPREKGAGNAEMRVEVCDFKKSFGGKAHRDHHVCTKT